MPGITSQQAQDQLNLWLAADTAVAKNQSYSIGTRSFTRADAAEITKKIEYWNSKVNELGGALRRGITLGVPS
jgi:Family of unknown function (DUF6148)